MTNKTIPQIRFRGFEGEWEEEKLGDIVQQIKSYPISRKYETKENTNIKYIHYGDIHKGKAKEIKKSSDISSILIKDASKYELLKKDDFIVADASEDYTGIANASYIAEDLDFNLIAGLHTIAMRPTKAQTKFLYYLFHTDIFKKFGKETGTGLKVYGISFTNLSKFNANYPKKEEQEKIGELFEKIDKLIESQSKLIEENKKLKKSLLQKMFPQKNEKIPQIRLKGFSGDWEEKKIGEMGQISSSGVDKKSYKGQKKIHLLNYMDVYNKKEISENNKNDLMIVTASDKEISEKNVMRGDIFFTPSSETREDIGHSMAIMHDLNGVVYSYHIVRFRPIKNLLDLNYSNYFANTEYVRRQLIQEGQGVQRITLKKEKFEKLRVPYTSLEEQKAIGNLFKSLDDKIYALEDRLNSYKAMKKSLLQKMFI